MPRIFDNIALPLLPALQQTLAAAERADFCVGYFNLRGWQGLAEYVERWPGGEGHCCRLLVGMHISPGDEARQLLKAEENPLDNQTAVQAKRRIAEDFRRQLTCGMPSNADEAVLRRLSIQIRTQKLFVKVYLRHSLHAKLYLSYRKEDVNNPVTGFLGSSNLTLAGLSKQGELNVDVLDHDACDKLARWFEDRWKDRWCIDISKELADIIDESWAGDRLVPPYHVYLKMAYHLAQEARAGLSEFRIPTVFGNMLLDFQSAAVKIAARHLNKRGGVLIGDVVGLGKSIMATALAKVFEEDHHTETLILCPKNLVPMWEDYVHRYRLIGRVLSISRTIGELPKLRRYRLVLIDESHNLRNKNGKRWRAIREYIERNESLTILLSATPYNKAYLDLSSQLALFLNEDADIGIRPEKLLSDLGGEHEFIRHYQCGARTLAAFEKSLQPDDWRDLMRLYMVRRTRGFIMQNYARQDERGRYLLFPDGRKSYFPKRIPKTLTFPIDDANPADPYARLYSEAVTNAIAALNLPRYGLGNYLLLNPKEPPSPGQATIIANLSRAGTRLMGFCRVNLFKRLESAGIAFILSLERHILRNFILLHALERDLDIPLGAQDAALLDERGHDEDEQLSFFDDDEGDEGAALPETAGGEWTERAFRTRAAQVYASYANAFRKRFKWLPSSFFKPNLGKDLLADAQALLGILRECGQWNPAADAKLGELSALLSMRHPGDKVLIFTQFADTARYLQEQLVVHGLTRIEAVTGQSDDPFESAWRFSPDSNEKRQDIGKTDELRVLIATDVLSEGQNLQDAHIVVNYDIPWAIIRLIQRAGRVDRIGQKAEVILCYSFMPADGVEHIIRLRSRLKDRLEQNAEVVGSDETFFADETDARLLRELYTEKDGILDEADDIEVDLASYAYQIWKNAVDADPALAGRIEALPNVVYATKAHESSATAPCGVLVYMRTAQGNDALAWVDEAGNQVTQSQLTILKAAACAANTPALPRQENHHELTRQGVEHISKEEKTTGGALGRPSGARFKTYERLKRLRGSIGDQRNLLISDDYVRRLDKVIEEIFRYPLYQSATDSINRQIRAGIDDRKLCELILALREDGRLCNVDEHDTEREPKLICTLGLAGQGEINDKS